MFLASMRSSIECRSVIFVFLIKLRSILKSQGPEKSRLCREPMLPAVGLEKTWVENGALPSGATPRPSTGFMAEQLINVGPEPVIWQPTMLSNCALLRLVLTVL